MYNRYANIASVWIIANHWMYLKLKTILDENIQIIKLLSGNFIYSGQFENQICLRQNCIFKNKIYNAHAMLEMKNVTKAN